MAHEFHSLADDPLTAVWRGREQWASKDAGLQWKPVPDAQIPDDTPVKRMRQIRSLARRFKAHSIDREGGRWELRLIATPVCRYQPNRPEETLDGALFAICQGTDPEIFLAIEARRTANTRDSRGVS
ncbi:MAG: hypothetical protein GXX96_18705 [Planctomycetaceae bacterium]|nr:hypothetical protein [Planctomycetaceae bacterium]